LLFQQGAEVPQLIRRSRYFFLLSSVVGAVVLAGLAAGLFVTIGAVIENIRFVRATDQILEIVRAGRALAQEGALSDALATGTLYDRLNGAKVAGENGRSSRFLRNAWGQPLTLAMAPSTQTLRIEDAVSTGICRRIIYQFGKDTQSLGLLRVEALDVLSASPWRTLFDVTTTSREQRVDAMAIQAACGTSPKVVLALTFALKSS
jgi:hypothetical protein